MQQQHARPTGRQKITKPQFRAGGAKVAFADPGPEPIAVSPGARSGLGLAMTPSQALAAFKRYASAVGLSRRLVDLIDYLMCYTWLQDWQGGIGPIVWPSDVELEDRLVLAASQRKVLIRAALDAGLIRLRRSPTGRRWGRRDKHGRIMEAFGFDLSPLAERVAEFDLVAAEWQARREEGKRLRREITSVRAHVHALIDLAMAEDAAGDDWPAMTAQADALYQARGRLRDPLALVPIVARMRALRVHVEERVVALIRLVDDKETGPAGPENRPRNTTTNQVSISEEIAAEGRERPIAYRRSSPTACASQASVAADSNKPAARQEEKTADRDSPLRGFPATPDFVLQIAPAFRDHVRSAMPSWAELVQAAFEVCSGLGISAHAWGQACIELGRVEATVAVAAVAAKHEQGKVKLPGGYLRKMVEAHQKDQLRLDRTLFGLAEGLRSAARERSGPSRPDRPGRYLL